MKSDLIYNKRIAGRALGADPANVKEIKRFRKTTWVWIDGQKPTFVSNKKMKEEFVQSRKEAAKKVMITPSLSPVLFYAQTEGKTERYVVYGDTLQCTCQDYANQIAVLGNGRCKHGYALLGWLELNPTFKHTIESILF